MTTTQTLLKRSAAIKTLAVTGLIAATLSLSACDFRVSFGGDPGGEEAGTGATPPEEQRGNNEPAETHGPGEPTEPTPAETDDGYLPPESDNGVGGDSGDPGVTIDEDGNGVVPQEIVEADVDDALVRDGIFASDVTCDGDMQVIVGGGSINCEAVVDGKTYYGTAVVSSIEGSTIYYDIKFAELPGT